MLKQKENGEYCYEKESMVKTVPNLAFLFENRINFDSHPIDWFELFFPRIRTKSTHPKIVTLVDLMS